MNQEPEPQTTYWVPKMPTELVSYAVAKYNRKNLQMPLYDYLQKFESNYLYKQQKVKQIEKEKCEGKHEGECPYCLANSCIAQA